MIYELDNVLRVGKRPVNMERFDCVKFLEEENQKGIFLSLNDAMHLNDQINFNISVITVNH